MLMSGNETIDEILEAGFASMNELHQIVANIDISTKPKWENYKAWQVSDGTKAGLLRVLRENAK